MMAGGTDPSWIRAGFTSMPVHCSTTCKNQPIYTGTHSDSGCTVPSMHVSGLLEKAVMPGVKPYGHRKNVNTWLCTSGDQTHDLCVCVKTTVFTAATLCLHLLQNLFDSSFCVMLIRLYPASENKMLVKNSLSSVFLSIFSVPGLVWLFWCCNSTITWWILGKYLNHMC